MAWSAAAALVAAVGWLAAPTPATATPGDLDPSFSRDGFVSLDLGGESVGEAVAIDEASRIVVAATAGANRRPSPAVARLRPNGKRDRGFGRKGIAEISALRGDGAAAAIEVLPDGGMIIGATIESGFAVARLSADGRADASFSGDGVSEIPFGRPVELAGLAAGRDGAITVVGSTANAERSDEILMARLTPFGALDTEYPGAGSFGFRFPGTEYSKAASVSGQADGSVLVAGRGGSGEQSHIAVARFGPAGDLDASFSDDGSLLLSFDSYSQYANDVTIDVVGRIVLATCCSSGVVRLTPEGSLDESFMLGGGPRGYAGNSLAIALDGRGRMVTIDNVGGCDRFCTPFDYLLARRTEDGGNDRRFSRDGILGQDFARSQDRALDLAIASDNRIVVVGESAGRVLVARHESSQGKPDADGDRREDRSDRCPRRYSRSEDGCPRFHRSLTMRWLRAPDLFTGRLHSREEHCSVGRRLELRREERGFDKILAEVTTGDRGRWKTDAALSPGVYYARIEAGFDPAIGKCDRARSNEITIR